MLPPSLEKAKFTNRVMLGIFEELFVFRSCRGWDPPVRPVLREVRKLRPPSIGGNENGTFRVMFEVALVFIFGVVA